MHHNKKMKTKRLGILFISSLFSLFCGLTAMAEEPPLDAWMAFNKAPRQAHFM